MSTTKSSEGLLTVKQAFNNALEKLKGKEKGKIYVWRQRYNEGSLSQKKISSILKKAGLKKVVEEKWMPLNPKATREEALPFEAFPKEKSINIKNK
jgi:adenine-specific DNA methylase